MLAALLLSAVLAQTPQITGDPEQQVEKVLATFDVLYGSDLEDQQRIEQAKAAVRELHLDRLSGVQLGRLRSHPAMLQDSGIADAVDAMLKSFLDNEGPDGATARVHFFSQRRRQLADLSSKVELYRNTFSRSGLEEAVEAGAIGHLFGIASPPDAELIDAVFDEFLSLQRFIDERYAVRLANGFPEYFEAMKAAQRRGKNVELQQIRKKMVAVAETTRGKMPRPDLEPFMENVISYLKGAYARGELLNHEAPDVQFLWTGESQLHSLKELKGRVVVLEFWATWCGPCVGGIPHLRALRERFSADEVAIIGVTNVEGVIVWPDGTSTNTGNDTQREFELMREYIKRQNINYTIAFVPHSTQGEFGVRGIPHIALIDAAGVVRIRDLHPGNPIESLAARIDELVRESPPKHERNE